MLSLAIIHDGDSSLVDQIVAGIKRQIDERYLRPGAKLPSIRDFAENHRISRFTVVEAYDRLVAMGYLQSRRGAGFYTTPPPVTGFVTVTPSDHHKRNEQLVWLIRRLLEADEEALLAGGPWLPNSWLDEAGSAKASIRSHAGMAPIYSNMGTRLAIRRCGNISL